MQVQIQKIIDDDFVNDFQKSISARDRWNALTRFLDVFAHICSGISIILAFVAGSVHLPVLSLLAGGFGVSMAISNQYSSYCKAQYESQSTLIQAMAKQVNATDELVDESATMNNDPQLPSTPAATPANSPVVHSA